MQGDGIISRRVPETAGAPERKGLILPTSGADSVPTQARGDRNLSGLPSLLVCRMTTKNLMLASYVPSEMRRLHKNLTHLLHVDCHHYRIEQTLPQAPSSSLGHPGDNLPAPKAKPRQDAEIPISHHAMQPAQKPGTVPHDKGAATTNTELPASPWI